MESGKPTKIRTTKIDDDWVDDVSKLVKSGASASVVVQEALNRQKDKTLTYSHNRD